MSRRVICDFCRRVGIGSTYEERNADNTRHEMTCPKRPQVPTDPDAAQAKDEKEMAMYVVIRTDDQEKPYHVDDILCHSLENARQDAAKYAKSNASKNPRFEIYKLVYQCAVEASIDLRET